MFNASSLQYMEKSEMDKYSEVAKKLFNNFNDPLFNNNEINQVIYDFYRRGFTLWHELRHRFDQLNISDPSKTLLVEDNDSPVIPLFLDFAKKNGYSLDEIHEVMFCIGEGDTTKDVWPIFEPKSDYKIDVICGPIMISNDKKIETAVDSLNDFLSNLIKNREIKNIGINICVNRFLSLFNGFAGYFHVYILGDVVLFEEMHTISSSPKGRKTFMMYDKAYANKTRSFFKEYQKSFTKQFNFTIAPDDIDTFTKELARCLPTFKKSNYIRFFDEHYIDNILMDEGIA